MIASAVDQRARIQFVDPFAPGLNQDRLDNVLKLSAMGIQVIPLIYGKKSPYFPYKNLGLFHTRLQWHNPTYNHLLQKIWSGRVNVGIITGYASHNLFILDCDTPEKFDATCCTSLATFGSVYAVRTSRGGHVWFYSADGPVVNSSKDRRPQDMDVLGHDKIAVVPPSYNKDRNSFYTWYEHNSAEPPTVKLSDINWLVDDDGLPYALKPHKTRHSKPRYSETTRDYLNGASIPVGKRHNRLVDATGDMLYYDTPDHVRSKVIPIALASGLDAKEVYKTVNSVIKNYNPSPRRKTAYHPATAADVFLKSIQWTGDTGANDKAVFRALVDRCKADATDGVFRATQRELSEMAHVSKGTVCNALKRLVARGLIENVNVEIGAVHSQFAQPSYWRFTETVVKTDVAKMVSKGFTLCVSTNDQNCNMHPTSDTAQLIDLLRERVALGQRSIDIFIYICQQLDPQSTITVASAMGIDRSTAYRHFQKLLKHGLLQPCGNDTYTAQLDRYQLAAIATDTGAHEATLQREARYDDERQDRIMIAIDKKRIQYDKQNRGDVVCINTIPSQKLHSQTKEPAFEFIPDRDHVMSRQLNARKDQPL